MKKYFLLIFTLLCIKIFSQNGNIGINTSSPQATLDIRGKNDTTPNANSTPGGVAATDGVLVPRVSDLATNGTINGQLVYLVADTTTPAFTKGFYYWNGTVWASVGGGADGDAWGVTGEDLTSAIKRTGSVSIGSIATTAPDAYTKLDVSSTNQGILIPRINLTSNTLDLNADGDSNVSNQPIGLLIFNSGTTLAKGFYFWSGTEWRLIFNTSGAAPTISTINCSGAQLSPASYTSGVPYTGTLSIPYTGGSGGSYSEGSTVTVNGLSFKLKPGTLETGGGFLNITVSGTPTVSTPTGTTVPIQGSTGNNLVPFLTSVQNCSATIGDQLTAEIKEVAFAGPLTITTAAASGRDGYHFVGTTPDGRFSVRVFVPTGLDLQANSNLQLKWNGTASDPSTLDIIHNCTYMWGGGATASSNQVRYPKNQWAGYNGDASGLVNAVAQTTTNNPTWFDPGVYASGIPEYRYYNWASADPLDKTFYQIEFMMAHVNPIPAAINATVCPAGTCNQVKVFFKIRQIKAL